MIEFDNTFDTFEQLPEKLHVTPGRSFHASLMRSMGAKFSDVATFFGVPFLNPEHPLVKARYPFFAPMLAPLQRAVNVMAFDAGVILTDDLEDVIATQATNLTIARAAFMKAVYADPLELQDEDLVENIDYLCEALLPTDYADSEDMRRERAKRYEDCLPDDRRVPLVDHASPWSVLMGMCGIGAQKMMQFGYSKAQSGLIGQGRLAIDDEDAIFWIADQAVQVAEKLRIIHAIGIDDPDSFMIDKIEQLTPSQLATAWQLFPTSRTQIETYTPYLSI
jgi:hypothetical protein